MGGEITVLWNVQAEHGNSYFGLTLIKKEKTISPVDHSQGGTSLPILHSSSVDSASPPQGAVSPGLTLWAISGFSMYYFPLRCPEPGTR